MRTSQPRVRSATLGFVVQRLRRSSSAPLASNGGHSNAKSPHDRFFYYRANRLEAVRSGRWKLRLGQSDPVLYDLDSDIGESQNLADQHADVVLRLLGFIDRFNDELGHGNVLSKNCRPAGWVTDPKYLTP